MMRFIVVPMTTHTCQQPWAVLWPGNLLIRDHTLKAPTLAISC